MKQTKFLNEGKEIHKIDFIYEPPYGSTYIFVIKIAEHYYNISKITDELTSNAEVQIRHIFVKEIDIIEKQIL